MLFVKRLYKLLSFSYFQDGLKTIEHFSGYIKELATKLQKIRQKQDEERKKLVDLRNTLRNSPSLDSREVRFFLLKLL